MPVRPLALCALVTSLALPASVLAQSSNTSQRPVASATTRESAQTPMPVLQTPQEALDQKLVDQVLADIGRSGPAALAPHIPALKTALDNVPADYAIVAPVGDAMVIRSADMKVFLPVQLALLASEDGRKASGIHAIQNTYGMVAQMLAFEAFERKDYVGAIDFTDRILAVQPNNPLALAEKIVALTHIGQCENGLLLAAAALASEDMILSLNHDLFLRRQGYCQIELGRFDEAKASYEAALKLNPDDQLSRSQLAYIAAQTANR